MQPLVACAVIALWAGSCAGWGLVGRRVLRLERGALPATLALGVATLVFLGGVLNLARIAVPAALGALLVAGLVPAALAARTWIAQGEAARARLQRSAPVVLAGAAVIVPMLVLLVTTQVAPSAYNIADDYEKYFTLPVRMLATGTVYGNPLSSIGAESVGGQAFLQGLIVAFFPIRYVNGADAVFGLLLCLLLAAQLGGERRGGWIAALAGMAAVVLIEPQYVNVSALYLGSAAMLAVAAFGADARELDREGMPHAAALGVLYATAANLKSTLALFGALHLVAATVAIATSTRSARRGARWAASATLAGGASLLPWLALHAPRYLAALGGGARAPIVVPEGDTESLGLAALFSGDELVYGASFRDYTVLVLAIAAAGLIAVWACRGADAPERMAGRMTLATAATGVASYPLMVWAFGPVLSGSMHATRYFTPIAIGVAPAAFACATRLVTDRRSSWRSRSVPVAIALVALAGFAPRWLHQVSRWLTFGTNLAFPAATSPPYLAYNHEVLEGDVRAGIERLQASIPAGEPILAWIEAPFYLDYARNPIVDFEPTCLSSPWAELPPVRWVLWEYDGFGTRPRGWYEGRMRWPGRRERVIAVRGLAFLDELARITSGGDTLFDDGTTRLVRLHDAPASARAPASATRPE